MSKRVREDGTAWLLIYGLFLFVLSLVGYNMLLTESVSEELSVEDRIRSRDVEIVRQSSPTLVEVVQANEDSMDVKKREKYGDEKYIEIVDSCGPFHEGECLRVRSGASTSYPVVGKVRTGMVLKVEETIENGKHTWHKIVFDEWLRYPERVTSDWYVADDFVEVIWDEGAVDYDGKTKTDKEIIVDRGDQKLYAFDGDELEMELEVSTGLFISPTPRGVFTIFKKTPSRYMQGPLPYIAGSDYYDLPGVPWSMYFTEQGAVIHGAYWHNSFGKQYSHGCVNVDPDVAEELYRWADLGTKVIVRD